MLGLLACDSSGNLISPSDLDWTSDQASFDTSALPVIANTTNVATINLSTAYLTLLNLTHTNRTSAGAVIDAALAVDWCAITNSTTNSNTIGVLPISITNSIITMSGAAYGRWVKAISLGNNYMARTCRIVGNAGSSGNRRGVTHSGTTSASFAEQLTIIGHGGEGYISLSSSTGQLLRISRSVIAGNAVGVVLASTASQTATTVIDRCMITGNTGNGIDASTNAHVLVTNSRLRDNGTDFANFGNNPQNLNNYTTDSDDAMEYVGSGDYRIKSSATIWGKGVGVSDQPGSSGVILSHPRIIGLERNLLNCQIQLHMLACLIVSSTRSSPSPSRHAITLERLSFLPVQIQKWTSTAADSRIVPTKSRQPMIS